MPVLYEESGKILEWRQLCNHLRLKKVWNQLYKNKLGRLLQGFGTGKDGPNKKCVAGSDTLFFVKRENIPFKRRKEISFSKVVCEVRPQKSDPNCACITISGNNIVYPGDIGTPTVLFELVKLIVNSLLSRRNSESECFDIKNFYLGTPLDRFGYVRIKFNDIPQEFINKCSNSEKNGEEWTYF